MLALNSLVFLGGHLFVRAFVLSHVLLHGILTGWEGGFWGRGVDMWVKEVHQFVLHAKFFVIVERQPLL